ncbi:MAG: hypothetical protein WA959_01010 [Rivularia sp. (in: cyanobacteria)]
MKDIQQTASELVIKNKPNLSESISIMIFTTFFIGIPFLMMLGLLSQIGVIAFKCKKVEPNQVNCEKQESKFFGLVKQPSIRFSQVKSAKFTTEEGIDSEGDVDSVAERTIDNRVTLVTSSGEVTAVEDFITINGNRGSASQMQQIANQLNNFIQSNQPSLVIEQDLGGDFYPIVLPLVFYLILGGIIGGGTLFFQFFSQTLIFDKKSTQLILEQKTLLGKKYEYYPLNEIQGIDIEEKYNSKKGTSYELKLIPKKFLKPIPKKIHKTIGIPERKLLDVKNLRVTIHDFLGIPLPKSFPYFFIRALFLEKLIAEENATTLLFAVVYAISIKRLP